MSNAPRYRLVGYDIGTAPDENGGWVHWTDHEAEIASLTAERDAALAGWDDQKQRHHECWVESVKTLYRALDAEAELAAIQPDPEARQAALSGAAATPTGWVIANGNNNRWRCVWEWESNAEWTDDITQALKFATRDDAERFSKEDEDAWLIYKVGIPPTTTPAALLPPADLAAKIGGE